MSVVNDASTSTSPSQSPSTSKKELSETNEASGPLNREEEEEKKESKKSESDAKDNVVVTDDGEKVTAAAETTVEEKEKEEGLSVNSPSGESIHLPPAVNAHVNGDWQAIWSPPHNMYYFYNMRTNETTWTNPLASSDTTSSNASALTSTPTYNGHYNATAAAAAAQGIDPSLAYLDPNLVAGPSNPSAYTYSAKFNARTGAFTRPDGRDPEHVSEYERMKRMNNFYFDMDQWQKEVDTSTVDEANKKRKKPTKKDLESFKERKKQKKLAKTAWLRT